jgi:hypothetical protein
MENYYRVFLQLYPPSSGSERRESVGLLSLSIRLRAPPAALRASIGVPRARRGGGWEKILAGRIAPAALIDGSG